MADHPSTFRAEDTVTQEVEWHDRAALHLASQSDGVLHHATALRRGSFAELIEQLMAMPQEERQRYVIEKAGDREYSPDEIAELARHPSFPRS
ncbi:hypothetical protein [Porphyrobacter sp. GA68]|uniref:hypothetical protein n=1 Tax=Porphyrobacter sp. GA68 TaxID=2883480 RepID=UPI001D184677|nr:hypothetical protein [Porphyrobacter sp. GA68]